MTIKKLAILAIIIIIALTSIGCEGNAIVDSAETVIEAGQTVSQIGKVHKILELVADQELAKPTTR